MSRIIGSGRTIDLHRFETDHLLFEPIAVSDANLIIELRGSKRAVNLHAISNSVDGQVRYLESYLERFRTGDEIYYVITERNTNIKCGLVRIHDLNSDRQFNWASFVMRESSSPILAIDATIAVYAVGFEFLDKEVCGPFIAKDDVPRVRRFHTMIGMTESHLTHEGVEQLIVTRERFVKRYPYFVSRRLGVIASFG